MSGSFYRKFRNDRGVPEICIGVREFKCIGVSGATRFRFDPRLTPLDADPPDGLFADYNAA